MQMTKFSVLWLYDIKMWKYSTGLPSHVLILQSGWIWLILFVWLAFVSTEEGSSVIRWPLPQAPNYCNLQGTVTGQKITDHFIWGLLFAFQGGKKSRSTPHLQPIHSLVLHTCETLRTAVYQPINPVQLKGSALLGQRAALAAMSLLCPASTSSGRKGSPHSLSLHIKWPRAFCA